MTPTASDWPARLRAACGQSLASTLMADTRPRRPANRRAAVLIGITAGARPAIYFTERSTRLKHHAGQISFPGGAIEAEDPSAAAAALREAREEIDLSPAAVTVLGELPTYRTVTGFRITPIVGWITAGAGVRADGVEVARLFTVPLARAMAASAYRYTSIEYEGQAHRVYSLDYQNDHIWGATAAMLVSLAARVAAVDNRAFTIDQAL